MAIFLRLFIAIIVLLPLALLVAGQLGMLRGKPQNKLGVTDGKFAAVRDNNQNIACSQANNSYSKIAPLATGKTEAVWPRIKEVVANMRGATVLEERPNYLRAEFQTNWLKFVDDVEFYRDDATNTIHMRSSSRLGRKDFGINRGRLEAIRERLN
jgi:uncharacterized protein (DUF1499 family)